MACAANPSPIPIAGSTRELSALVGEWVGEYQSPETGRAGTISFKLEAGRDTAFGRVIMVPADITGIRADSSKEVPPAIAGISQVLTIRFVRVSGDTISGMIDPYSSPDCNCALRTTFRGEMRPDRIAGTFRTQHSGSEHSSQSGTWVVRRKSTP
jgi:hypothetical protein